MNIDIKNLPEKLKTFLINLITLPFWYISVYIYHIDFYKTNDYVLIFSVCFCLMLISSLISSVTILINDIEDSDFLDESNVVISVVFQIIILSFIIFLGYLSKIVFGLCFQFYGFLLTYFSLIILFFIKIVINKRKKKEIKKTKQT